MKKCIILANGKPPGKSVMKFLSKNLYTTLICADGGANNALKMGLIPNYIIGDFDSIEKKVLKYFKSKSKIIKINRQNDTDVEKCLKFALGKGYSQAVLLGATGDRLDHSICNIGIVLKFYDKIRVSVIHDKSIVQAYSGKVYLNTVPNEIISIYGISPKTKITSNGLKYKLNSASLPFGIRESTSNVALSNQVTLNIEGGKVLVVRQFELLKKHGLF